MLEVKKTEQTESTLFQNNIIGPLFTDNLGASLTVDGVNGILWIGDNAGTIFAT